MPSLSAHLRQPEDHSRLPFHPSCPVCRRDRLAGSLDGEELVSRRTQAVIAAGLLAFSTGGAPAAAASVPDEVSEGTMEVVEGGDSSTSLDVELGGEALQLPDEVSAMPNTPAPLASDDDDGPLEQEPVADVQEPVVEGTDDGATVAPAEPPPAAAAEPEAPPAEAPATSPPAEGNESETDVGRKAEDFERREAPKTVARKKSRPEPAAAPTPSDSAPVPAAEPAPAPSDTAPEPAPATSDTAPIAAAEPAPAPPETIRVVARASAGRAAPGDRVHTVRPGESLWSIAADLLGERATVARIAREVNRLWELNDDRIASGDPDLLFSGTRLRLR